MKEKLSKLQLPHFIWCVQDIKKIELEAINNLRITCFELMQRSGLASYELARKKWPTAYNWLILCGSGKNGGDGYIIAQLAHLAGIKVTVIACSVQQKKISKEVQQARNAWICSGGTIYSENTCWPNNVDLIIDAIFGTGLNRAPSDPYKKLINMINIHTAPVLSIDMPSGLIADNGMTPGVAVVAHDTISMIALKPGQIIGKSQDYIGCLHYHDLGLSKLLATNNAPIIRYDTKDILNWLKPRKSTLYKGDNGRLLVIGGDIGMGGAIRMTAEAALRSGAGLVRVLTHTENVHPTFTTRPELMVTAFSQKSLKKSLEWADVIVIGPGLGQRDWAKQALEIVVNSEKRMLWDADALNILATHRNKHGNRIITPHIGEAARLLDVEITEIQDNRLHFVQLLAQQYGGIAVLKDARTVISGPTGLIAIADVGNGGMATGGMGDVLSGIIAAMLGQQLNLIEAAYAGCVIHGSTADAVARKFGMRGLLATDLFKFLWKFVNPEMI